MQIRYGRSTNVDRANPRTPMQHYANWRSDWFVFIETTVVSTLCSTMGAAARPMHKLWYVEQL